MILDDLPYKICARSDLRYTLLPRRLPRLFDLAIALFRTFLCLYPLSLSPPPSSQFSFARSCV